MNALAATLLWCFVQVTLLCVFAAALGALLRKRPGAAALVTRLAVVAVLLLTAAVAAPTPSWFAAPASPDNELSSEATAPPATDGASLHEAKALGETSGIDVAPAAFEREQSTPAEHFWSAGVAWWRDVSRNVEQAPATVNPAAAMPFLSIEAPDESQGWSWQSLLVGLMLASMALGLARLVVGWGTVLQQAKGARPVRDAWVQEELALLTAKLSFARPVEVRETGKLTTAATFGWRRPVILLPLDWRVWSQAELRAVLAHELSHIACRHFPQWIVAQLGLTLHFHHPLVHWLTSRLRLEQEYEADSLAATLTGGARPYLETLAGLAIRQSDGPLAWPARAFLPTRRTLLRRIEMLRDIEPKATASTPLRIAAALLIVAGGVFASGVKPPSDEGHDTGTVSSEATKNPTGVAKGNPGASVDAGTDSGSSPSRPPTPQEALQGWIGKGQRSSITEDFQPSKEALGPIELEYIPGDAIAVVAVRPAKLLHAAASDDDLKLLLALLPGEDAPPKVAALRQAFQAEQITLVVPLDSLNRMQDAEAPTAAVTFILRFPSQDARDAFVRTGWSDRPEPLEVKAFAGVKYTLDGATSNFEADERTLIVGDEGSLRRMILSGPRMRSDLVAGDEWQEIAADAHIAAAVNTRVLSQLLPTQQSAAFAPFTPLFTESDRALTALRLERSALQVQETLICRSEEGAARAAETLQAALVLARNFLAGAETQLATAPAGRNLGLDRDPGVTAGLTALQRLTKSAKIESNGAAVTLTTSLELDPHLIAGLAGGVMEARAAAAESRQRNDLRQIAIALHNYHERHGRFPPAVVTDPESQVERSWRVELLPYLGETQLYELYRKHEPWDSAHNRQILARMPAVYGEGTQTAVMGVVAIGGVFSARTVDFYQLQPDKRMVTFPILSGTRLTEITDGTSNTILFVQHPSKSIEWTKPEDVKVVSSDWPIKFTSLGDLLKGDFEAVMADGSVKHIQKNPDPKQLARWLIINDGGQAKWIFSDPQPTTRREPATDDQPIRIPPHGDEAGMEGGSFDSSSSGESPYLPGASHYFPGSLAAPDPNRPATAPKRGATFKALPPKSPATEDAKPQPIPTSTQGAFPAPTGVPSSFEVN